MKNLTQTVCFILFCCLFLSTCDGFNPCCVWSPNYPQAFVSEEDCKFKCKTWCLHVPNVDEFYQCSTIKGHSFYGCKCCREVSTRRTTVFLLIRTYHALM